jgi:cell division septation protein DedD
MKKYLIEILKDSNTIIIPGLGALTVTNKDKGEFMFMPFLKHDDGTLKRFISETESCDESVAKEKIDQFVAEVKSVLDQGGSYPLEGLGLFEKDSSGDVVFGAFPMDQKVQDETAGNESIEIEYDAIASNGLLKEELPPQDEIIVEQTVQVEAVLEAENSSLPEHSSDDLIVSDTEEKPVLSKIEPDIDSKEDTAIVVTTVAEPVEELIVNVEEDATIVSPSAVEYTEQQQWEDDLDLPPINAKVERPKKPIIEKAQKDKKKRSPLIFVLIVLTVLFVAGAIGVGVFYKEIKTALFAKETNDTTVLAEEKQFEFTEVPEDNQGEEPIESGESELENEFIKEVISEPQKTEQVSSPKPAVSGSYFLVVGSFQNEANANRFSDRMKSEGNESTIISQNNGFYLVTIGSYPTESEAKAALTEKIQRYPKVWLFKRI